MPRHDEWDRWERVPVAKSTRNGATPRRHDGRNLYPLLIAVVFLAAAMLGIYFLLGPQALDPRAWFGADETGGVSAVRRPNQSVIFSGRADQLTAGSGNAVQDATAGDAQIVWIRSSRKVASAAGATDGVSVKIPDELARQIQGSRVRITVKAGRADAGSEAPFAVAYSVAGVASSGWIVFTPTTMAQNYSFVFNVPRTEPGTAQNIGIWADITGRSIPLAVWEIAVEKLS